MTERTALVAGAAGFLGSHLTENLLRDGWTVIGIDNLSTGRTENLKTFRKHPSFRFLRRDLSRRVKLPPAEAVFHLASPASPPHYQRDPIACLAVNAFGTAQLAEHAHRSGARFFLASTSEVYGDPEVHPQPESYFGHVNPYGPRSCYDEGKRFAEAMTLAWEQSKGLDARIARIFNTYGPRMALDDGRVVTQFLVEGWRGEPITVHGEGKQTRSFCYVSDLIEGFRKLFDSSVKGPVNLGNPETEMSVGELAERVRALTGGRSTIVHTERGRDDPERRRPDISRAKELLGWAPKVPLTEGLEKTSLDVQERLRRASRAAARVRRVKEGSP
ncbi:MAG: GDP-mannose 4,6-dehydratase [Euryarchaeota archaeon]|nr:GDP-mannose 4,6-dehydratase [Euryarchaeota archaeon]MDE1836221.1 GDP-mannose 4,6-dehydratase [Euryarchaeota archaeon]MDE1880874.1 GDP-mannose 4,6-dehydratase [Euryarchaeota archaeon]MDE2045018.1 GDP-mannose 4,6-dehydratase [Thermoplasmata archaeon]